MRERMWVVLRVVTGLCAAFVTVRGALGVYGIEFREDTLISILYCVLPFSSFFVFLLAKPRRLEFCLHAMIAAGYLATFATLNWRTCASFGYCTTVAATVWTTFVARPVMASFAVVLFSAMTTLMDRGRARAG